MAQGIRFWLLGLAIACATASVTIAQNAVGTGGLEIASVTGKFSAMQGNQIKVTAADKQEYFVAISNQTNLRYQGKADPKFLMPGLLVRFSAQLTQAGMAEVPVKACEVFTLSQHRMSPEQQREQTPGVYQEGGDVGAGAQKTASAKLETKKPDPKKPDPKKPESNKTDKAAPKPTAAAQNYRVVGQILAAQGNKLTVQAGQARIQLELDPQAEISVSSSDTMFCEIGDEVKVSGLRTVGQDKFIQAETIQITGAKPLGPAEGKAAKNAKTSRTSKDKAKADPAKPEPKKMRA